MSYARWGCDNSAVYVYDDVGGGTVCECVPQFRCSTHSEMIDHLLGHRAAGRVVPAHTLTDLAGSPDNLTGQAR